MSFLILTQRVMWWWSTFQGTFLIFLVFYISFLELLFLFQFPVGNILFILVILLNATYIWYWLKYFWWCRSKRITSSHKLRSCTLWKVHAHNNASGNWALFAHGYDFFFLNRIMLHVSWLVSTAYYIQENPTTLLLIQCSYHWFSHKQLLFDNQLIWIS